MNKVTFIVIFIFLLICSGYTLTADEILFRVDSNRSVSTNFTMNINIEDYVKGQLSQKNVLKCYIKGMDKAMVKYIQPANMKDRKILMIDDDMWVFIPNTKRPVRLTPSQRLLGQASNGDVVKVRFSYDYSAVQAGEETISDIDDVKKQCYVMELTAKKKGATYHKLTLWVEKETFYPVKAVFFALSGKKMKTAYYNGLKDMEGRNVISKTTIFDEVIKDNFTTIENSDQKSVIVEDRYFNKEYLQRM